jgi:hypothetical protein
MTESPGDDSETAIDKKITNPVSTTWSLKLQETINVLALSGHGHRTGDTLTFRPFMPVWLATDLKLFVRPKFTLLDDKPYVAHDEVHRTTGFGDTILDLGYPRLSSLGCLGSAQHS